MFQGGDGHSKRLWVGSIPTVPARAYSLVEGEGRL